LMPGLWSPPEWLGLILANSVVETRNEMDIRNYR